MLLVNGGGLLSLHIYINMHAGGEVRPTGSSLPAVRDGEEATEEAVCDGDEGRRGREGGETEVDPISKVNVQT